MIKSLYKKIEDNEKFQGTKSIQTKNAIRKSLQNIKQINCEIILNDI
jgi:hypothetical protein